jgi:hypothetical protein
VGLAAFGWSAPKKKAREWLLRLAEKQGIAPNAIRSNNYPLGCIEKDFPAPRL